MYRDLKFMPEGEAYDPVPEKSDETRKGLSGKPEPIHKPTLEGLVGMEKASSDLGASEQPEKSDESRKRLWGKEEFFHEPTVEGLTKLEATFRESIVVQKDYGERISAQLAEISERFRSFLEQQAAPEGSFEEAIKTKPDLGATETKTDSPTSKSSQDNQAA